MNRSFFSVRRFCWPLTVVLSFIVATPARAQFVCGGSVTALRTSWRRTATVRFQLCLWALCECKVPAALTLRLDSRQSHCDARITRNGTTPSTATAAPTRTGRVQCFGYNSNNTGTGLAPTRGQQQRQHRNRKQTPLFGDGERQYRGGKQSNATVPPVLTRHLGPSLTQAVTTASTRNGPGQRQWRQEHQHRYRRLCQRSGAELQHRDGEPSQRQR